MKMVRRIFDMLVAAVATVLMGMLSYLAMGGENLAHKFIPWTELVLVGMFLVSIVLNSPHYWNNVKLLILGVIPLLGLIASAVLPQYLDIEVPIVASIVFYVYVLYWHIFLGVTEKNRSSVPVENPVQQGKPKAIKKAKPKPKE